MCMVAGASPCTWSASKGPSFWLMATFTPWAGVCVWLCVVLCRTTCSRCEQHMMPSSHSTPSAMATGRSMQKQNGGRAAAAATQTALGRERQRRLRPAAGPQRSKRQQRCTSAGLRQCLTARSSGWRMLPSCRPATHPLTPCAGGLRLQDSSVCYLVLWSARLQ